MTIVILAWNAWPSTEGCLESLRPTLGLRDQVVVVDNGSTDGTGKRLGRYPWIDVVSNEENRGFAQGCNDGAALARNDILVFLNNDTLLAGRWIDALVAPFDADDKVGATGPRSNFVSGPQVADGASYLSGDMGAMRRFARTWAQEHRGETSPTERLVGFCLAVRRGIFEELGGFDPEYGTGGYEDDDLCRRIVGSGHTLLIAHESFVHHEGHKTFDVNGLDWYAEQESNRERFEARFGQAQGTTHDVSVSACIITKDEAANIEACLSSLRELVSEIVVYDTGSTDDTVELARSLGATVIEGYWDDDFSRARNAALEHCTGDWIAWLDADETLVCDDVPALRSALAQVDPQIDGFSVPIHNLTGAGIGAGFVHSACRLFRRARCEWAGRLHEQVAGRGDHRGIHQSPMEIARILHTGYLDETMRARNKTERNLRVAQAEVDKADGWDMGFSLTSLGRSYLTAGRFEEAVDSCQRALEHTDNLITRRLATRSVAEALTYLGRLDEALHWVAELRAISGTPVQADVAEGRIRLAQHDCRAALALFDRIGTCQFDDDGFEVGRHMFAEQRVEALVGLGRTSEAADVLLEVLVERGVLDVHLGILADCLLRSGRPLDEIARAIPADKSAEFLGQVLQLVTATADGVLEACFEHFEDTRMVLAASASLGRRLSIERALTWSARMRSAGYVANCPLIAIATGAAVPPARARAAATAVRAFGDPRGRDAFVAALREAQPLDRQTILDEVEALCPELAAVARTEAEAQTTTPAAPTNADPRVSIVIPCFNRAELTLGCLQSLQAHTDPGLYEVLVVDNGSADATTNLGAAQGPRFRVVRNEENTGFGPACNQGAALARGEYVLFLNNDTVVLPGWLEPLVAALDEDPAVAAVQPKLLYPDGRLNDAGGLVFGGGEPWVYGKGHPEPEAPQFSCRRAPDYASGACLLVRRLAFEQVGGFDDRYAPAYYEDTDLSFALRDAGWKVLFEPTSRIVHVEGGTAGTDVVQGLKRHQATNAKKFAEKWSAELGRRPRLDPAGVEQWAHRPQGGFGPGESLGTTGADSLPAAQAAASRGLSLLVMDPFMPVFDRASGGLRTFTMLRCLRRAGHAVSFYALAGGSRRYAEAVGQLGIPCYGGDLREAVDHSRDYASAVWPAFEALFEARRFDAVIVSPWSTAEVVTEWLRALSPETPIIVDTNDVHFRRLEREAAILGRTDGVAESRRRELAVYRQADRVVCVTEEDASAVRSEIPDAHIVIVPNAHAEVECGPGFDERSGCLFVGNFNHPPNGDALDWWHAEIGPLLSAELPAAGLTVVGNDPRGTAAAMAGPGIEVVGAVPSTLPFLHQARVSVAPLRYGAGMKGKVGEALVAGLPVVLTSVAAEGMGIVDGEQALVADTAEAFVDAVRRLHTDQALWQRLREAGREHAAEHLGVDRMRRAVDQMLAGLEPLADRRPSVSASA